MCIVRIVALNVHLSNKENAVAKYLLSTFLMVGSWYINMGKKKFIFLFVLIFFLTIFFLVNQKTTRLIGVNYKITESQIPIYLKIMDFYDRHYNYKYLVKNINKNVDNEKDVILNTTRWIQNKIKKIPEGVDIIDNENNVLYTVPPFYSTENLVSSGDQAYVIDGIMKEYQLAKENQPGSEQEVFNTKAKVNFYNNEEELK